MIIVVPSIPMTYCANYDDGASQWHIKVLLVPTKSATMEVNTMTGVWRKFAMAHILSLALVLTVCALYAMTTEAEGAGQGGAPSGQSGGRGVFNYPSGSSPSQGSGSKASKQTTPDACPLKHQPTGSGKLQPDGTYKYPTSDPRISDIWNPKTREWRELGPEKPHEARPVTTSDPGPSENKPKEEQKPLGDQIKEKVIDEAHKHGIHVHGFFDPMPMPGQPQSKEP